MNNLKFNLTSKFTCGYFAEKEASYALLDETTKTDIKLQTFLAENGFRRSHHSFYLPHCDNCSECISCRVEVAKFKPSKSQKRCIKLNKNWTHKVIDAEINPEITALYNIYQDWKHPDGEMSGSLDFLLSNDDNTKFILTYDQETLISVSTIDVLLNGISAVYNFYHPDYYKFSLGTYAILHEIEYAQQQGMTYVFLGYYLANSAKMNYKIKFQPLELFIDKSWQVI